MAEKKQVTQFMNYGAALEEAQGGGFWRKPC